MVLLNLKSDPNTIPSCWLDIEPTPNLIFVIVPGAGTFKNKEAYQRLQKKYNLVYFGKTGNVFDVYPKNWEDNSLVTNKGPHLGGIFQYIRKYIDEHNQIPEAIICGSRGAQVTIGKIWEGLWRGPTIIINSGCLTTKTIIPEGVQPIFIGMGKDYFVSVNSPQKIVHLYKKLSQSKQQAYLLFMPEEQHMPNLNTYFKDLLLNILEYILHNKLNFEDTNKLKIYSI